ncbi:MAG: amidohydrolase family protein [Nitrospinae bacterium]|nr:amidohydrolase family protein [Nitrospinota bacterium]
MKITGAKVYGAGGPAAVRDIHISEGKIAEHSEGETLSAAGCIAVAGGMDIHAHPLALTRLAALTGMMGEWGDLNAIVQKYFFAGFTFFVEAGLDVPPSPSADIEFAWLGLGERAGGIARKFVGGKGVEEFFSAPETEIAPHIHLPHLAKGGSLSVLERFLKRLDGRRCHLSHVSHYAFEEKNGKLIPTAGKAARLLAESPNVTFDCGPVVFGPALTFTADEELARRVSQSGGQMARHDKSPYVAVPYTFRKERYIDALLWLNGMELLLFTEDISRAALSIDYPSGGRIEGYPFIIEFLMNRDARNGFLKMLNADAVAASSLGDISREFSVQEVLALTRENPARIMGLNGRGHLRPGAVADVVLYGEGKLFSRPKHVFRNGILLDVK